MRACARALTNEEGSIELQPDRLCSAVDQHASDWLCCGPACFRLAVLCCGPACFRLAVLWTSMLPIGWCATNSIGSAIQAPSDCESTPSDCESTASD
eukprot:1224885-Pyramimonas_sp.AAC.1